MILSVLDLNFHMQLMLETFQFLKYGNLACIPNSHTTMQVFFFLRSPKVKIQAFNRLKNGEGKLLGFYIEYSVM